MISGDIIGVLHSRNVRKPVEHESYRRADYGLGATVWGRNLERAFDVAMRIEAGTVWINEHMVFDPHVTARGAKLSGFGGELGPEGLNSYTQGYVVYQTSSRS